MGMDLHNEKGDYFRFGMGPWSGVLEQAVEYGWKPTGTTCEGFENWDGNYITNDGQTVSAKDAANLADAIQRIIDEGDPRNVYNPEHPFPFYLAMIQTVKDQGMEIAHTSLTSDISREDATSDLREFIAFCRKGAFSIH